MKIDRAYLAAVQDFASKAIEAGSTATSSTETVNLTMTQKDYEILGNALCALALKLSESLTDQLLTDQEAPCRNRLN